ncbi:MAG: ABC transporter ATP-binding protein [Rhizobiales bacterium]|nr:ABC transporter ATP-binding protein [Hyphomicrobiales bacterium]MBN8984938.1 ABC transporter ATP-binding protein [Hyphomicrobiales bacterium]MBN9000974.1 ABC transporter ATP-binding protein [Hyphomicrobiales bacterium]
MPAARLEVAGLSAGYGPTQIVQNITFDVPAGGRLAILGRNGVGKTTLLATLMGLSTRHAGSVRIGDVELTRRRTSARALAGVGYVPQSRDVFASLTVEENLATGLKGRSRAALAEAYEMFPRLGERRRHLGGQLSGGEQQMLSMARTMLGQPSLLLLDEPLEGLAPVICDELMSMITRLAGSGDVTVVLVEQQIERALDFADRVLILERGREVWSGAPDALRADRALIERLLGVGIH